MGPGHHQPTYESMMPTGSTPTVATNMASAPTPGEFEKLEQARYLKLAKQKKRLKVQADKYADFNKREQTCG